MWLKSNGCSNALGLKPADLHINEHVQSVALPDGSRKSPLQIREPIEYLYEDTRTLYETFQRGLRVSADQPCLGRISDDLQIHWMTYRNVYDMARSMGSGLATLELERQGFVGVWAINSCDWLVIEQTCNMFSYVCVPLYDTLGDEALQFIIDQTEMRFVFCDKLAKVDKLLQMRSAGKLQYIFVNDTIQPGTHTAAAARDIQLLTYTALLEKGSASLVEPQPPTQDDIATICYTSGTTGDPKGVMLSHRNVVSNVAGAMVHLLASGCPVTCSDVHFSYLPLAHMFERINVSAILMEGGRMVFFRGDIKLLLDDLKLAQPTYWATVPRLLNRLYDKVLSGVRDSWMRTFVFNWALRWKLNYVNSGVICHNTVADLLVFRKIRAIFGGRLKRVITGSAPISREVFEFCRAAFGCHVLEGYGQTECGAPCTLTLPHDSDLGHVGAILACNMIKLVDVPETDYFSSQNQGEVCVKGTNVMVGYFKDPQRTHETVDEDGWLHTGDIGQWCSNGALRIIDRKKHLFKLAQGEYIAPERLEVVYTRSDFVAQVFVDGSSLANAPVAVVVPDPDRLMAWARENGKSLQNGLSDVSHAVEHLCTQADVNRAILDDMHRTGKGANLKGFEQVAAIHLHPEMFSVENDLLTPTFKAKRPALRKKFSAVMERLYVDLNGNRDGKF